MAKKKVFEYKTIKSKGAKIYLIKIPDSNEWKFHRYGGPAIEPFEKDSEFKKSYFLYGIEYDLESYELATKQREDMVIKENIENMKF
jgi:hypothetical protein